MDVDFWATGVHSAKNISALQDARLNHSSNHLIIGDEEDDEMRAWFPCPFCYVEIEVPLLCIHLQEEHCFDLKNAVCPICAANLGKDAISHFTMQHAHSIKRRKKTQKSSFYSNVSTNIIKDIRELSSYSMSGELNRSEPAPDPLLSPFVCYVPLSDPKYSGKDVTSYVAATNDLERKTSQKEEVQEQDYEERKQKAAFLLELIASTIFSDSMEEN